MNSEKATSRDRFLNHDESFLFLLNYLSKIMETVPAGTFDLERLSRENPEAWPAILEKIQEISGVFSSYPTMSQLRLLGYELSVMVLEANQESET